MWKRQTPVDLSSRSSGSGARLIDRRKVGHNMRRSDGSRALVRLSPLGNVVGGMTITLLLGLIPLGTVRLLRLGEVWSSGIEGLGREHVHAHHRHLAGIGLELRAVGLQLMARKLLVEEHVPDAMLGGDVVVKLAVEEPR